MGNPITPRPMNATFALTSFSFACHPREDGGPVLDSRLRGNDVNRIRWFSSFEHRGDIFRGRTAHGKTRRARGAADMRGHHDVAQVQELRMDARLVLED